MNVNKIKLFRYHNTRMVNYDTHNGFSVSSILMQSDDQIESNTAPSTGKLLSTNNVAINKTASTIKPKKAGSLTPSISILSINDVSFLHDGNYTCSPSNSKQASITVHVLRGN